MNSIKLLDCTLRDGAYINKANFGVAGIKGIIEKLQDARVDIIECGWLKNNDYKEGTTYFHTTKDLEKYIINKNSNIIYTLMIDWNMYDLNLLSYYDGKSADAIRVVFPYDKYNEGIEVAKEILKKGYKVYLQAANTLAYSNDDLIKLSNKVNSIECEGLSIVDTFGAMYEEDLERILNILDLNLKPNVKLGYHSHNNQQLSFALCIHFIKLMKESNREIIVDSSLCGMGRGAGNAPTELVINYVNRKYDCHYNIDSIMDAIDIYMEPFKEKYEWGYSTPYLISGMYCCHVNNIAYLLDNHRTSARDMRNIIESMNETDRRKYDYDLLEKKYIENQNKHVDDSKTIDFLSSVFNNKEILLIAPGKSSINNQKEILNYISINQPIVIGVNSIVPNYKYDYLFFANKARYEYASKIDENVFDNTKHILLSNIKNSSDNEYIIEYNKAIKSGYKYFDNAVITLLRVLNLLGVKKVSMVGFDGFKNKYNESYADSNIPSLNPNNNWDELNKEIKQMFEDYKKAVDNRILITFITDSIFNSKD